MDMKKIKVIACDIDGVLVDTPESLRAWHNREYGTTTTLEELRHLRFKDAWGVTEEEALRRFYRFIEAEGEAIPAVEGASEVLQRLAEEYMIAAVTARNACFQSVTERLLRSYFKDSIRDVYCLKYDGTNGEDPKKSEVLRKIHAELLIDDSVSHVLDASSRGIQSFLYPSLWNLDFQDTALIKRVNSWKDIGDRLL